MKRMVLLEKFQVISSMIFLEHILSSSSAAISSATPTGKVSWLTFMSKWTNRWQAR